MTYNPAFDHRRSIRIKGFDYSQPASYYVTLVTYERECFLGEIENGKMKQSLAGQCVDTMIQRLPQIFSITSDAWIVMPNHVHFVCTLREYADAPVFEKLDVGSSFAGTTPHSLGSIVQNLKSTTSRYIHRISRNLNRPIWQRNYYEHIIRDQNDFERIVEYIELNPANWESDDLQK
jgi:putative transposase